MVERIGKIRTKREKERREFLILRDELEQSEDEMVKERKGWPARENKWK